MSATTILCILLLSLYLLLAVFWIIRSIIDAIDDTFARRFSVQTGNQAIFVSDIGIVIKEVIRLFPVLIPDLPVPVIVSIGVCKDIVKRSPRKIGKLLKLNHLP